MHAVAQYSIICRTTIAMDSTDKVMATATAMAMATLASIIIIKINAMDLTKFRPNSLPFRSPNECDVTQQCLTKS